jgi:hypothetical protein
MLSTVSPVSLLIAVLAVWRVTHLLWDEDGPWNILARLRRLAGNGWFGTVLDCFYCLSLWMAAPLGWLWGHTWLERILLWLALSAGAILLERITADPSDKFPGPLADNSQSMATPSSGVRPAEWHEERLTGSGREN